MTLGGARHTGLGGATVLRGGAALLGGGAALLAGALLAGALLPLASVNEKSNAVINKQTKMNCLVFMV